MDLLGYKNVEIKKSPLHRLAESADKLRVRVLAYDDVSAVVISDMLYRGDYESAYKKCIERFGATDSLTFWAYDLSLQWEIFMRNSQSGAKSHRKVRN